MRTNPFTARTSKPIEENTGDSFADESAAGRQPSSEGHPAGGEFKSASHARRFAKRAGYASLLFLVLVGFVFCEIKHSRELYRINRLLAISELERRQLQEQLRLGEAREAGLVAELHRLQSLPHDAPITKASYTLPNRRH